jgi:hypothetical protein
MAELLVRAKGHWMDSFTQGQIDALPSGAKDSFYSRTQLGDIIVVRDDGWEWGREECLPNFVVIKLPGVAVEDVKEYEEPLMDNTDPEHPKMLKHRKHQVSQLEIQSRVDASESVVEIPAGKGEGTDPIADFMDNIIIKTE